MVHLGNDWDQVLAGEFEKDYYLELRKFLLGSKYEKHVFRINDRKTIKSR